MSTDPASTSPAGDDATIAGLSYEQARTQLEEVVTRLESGDLPLDDLMTLWERGERLAAQCELKLAGARQRLDAVRRSVDGPGSTG